MKINAVKYHYGQGRRAASLAIDAGPLDIFLVITAYRMSSKPRFTLTFYIWRWIKRITI